MRINVSSALLRQYLAIFIINLSVFTTGMSLSWPSPILVKLRSVAETPLSKPMTEEEGSWMVSLGFLGGFLFVLGGTLMDAIGRKKSMILTAIPKLAMGLFCIFATEAWMLILARTILITTDCFVISVVSIYASEVADKEQRGPLGSFLQLFSSLGGLVTLTVGPYTNYKSFNTICVSLIAVTSVCLLWLPESPYFLYKKGRTEEAIGILNKYRISEEVIKQEIEDYEITLTKYEEKQKVYELFRNRTFLKSLALGHLVLLGVQLVGFSTVPLYLQTILQETNTNVEPEIGSVIIGILQIVSCFCTIFITKRFNTRTIYISMLCFIFLGLVGLGTFFQISQVKNYTVTGFLNYLPIISLILVTCCYCMGLGSLMWPTTAELFDSHSRAIGVSICLTISTILIFIMNRYFSSMTLRMGLAGTFWFFSGMTVILTVLIGLFLPETKGKTFNEIQMALEGKNIGLETEK